MTSATQTRTEPAGHTDPAAVLTGYVPVQTRSARLRSYAPADFPTPTGREVNWLHTPLDRIADVLEDADGSAGAVDVVITAPETVEVGALSIGQAPRGEVFIPEDRPAAIAWARTPAARHIRIPADVELDAPVTIEVHGGGGRSLDHIVIEAAPHSKGTVLLRHRGTAALTQNVEIIVRDGAHLDVITVQEWDDDAVHAATHQARVLRDATLRHTVVSFGGAVVRVNPSTELAGTGSTGEMFGLSYCDPGQHFESQVFLFHRGAETTGDVLYKGALQGDGAHSVWVGDVLIGPDAVGTDSYEANRNLVLTEGSRADSIPNLEIETGDIKGAGHASATGRFDDEQLFYLQARGITEDEARRLVVLGFLAEIVQKIGFPELESQLMETIERELAEGPRT